MAIKQFNPPSYEEWRKCEYNYVEAIGVYRCAITRWAWNQRNTTYMLAVAASPTPTNLNVEQVIRRVYRCNWTQADAEEQLRKWYEDTVKYLHEQWTQHISDTYLCK